MLVLLLQQEHLYPAPEVKFCLLLLACCELNRTFCVFSHTYVSLHLLSECFRWLPSFLRLVNHLGCMADFQLCLQAAAVLMLFHLPFSYLPHCSLCCGNRRIKTAPWWPFSLQNNLRQRMHSLWLLWWCFSCSWDSTQCHLRHHHHRRRQFTACSLQSIMWGEGKLASAYLLSCFC